jgi:hypothetical protein
MKKEKKKMNEIISQKDYEKLINKYCGLKLTVQDILAELQELRKKVYAGCYAMQDYYTINYLEDKTKKLAGELFDTIKYPLTETIMPTVKCYVNKRLINQYLLSPQEYEDENIQKYCFNKALYDIGKELISQIGIWDKINDPIRQGTLVTIEKKEDKTETPNIEYIKTALIVKLWGITW